MSCSIVLRNLAVKKGEKVLFSGLNLRVGHKEKIAIIGQNGAGKSSLLEVIAGLDGNFSGEIELFHETVASSKEFEKFRPEIGILFQNPDEQFLCASVFDDVAFTLNSRGDAEAETKTERILRDFNIFHLKDKVPFHLSGGEKKLVALAGVLVSCPKILLLDEPTAGLDEAMQRKLAQILASLEVSQIIVSHDKAFLDSVVTKFYSLDENGLSEI